MKKVFYFKVFYFLVLLIWIVTDSCVSEYTLPLPFDGPLLVVDGWITDKPNDSFLRVGWTTPPGSGICINVDNPRQQPYCPENPNDPYRVVMQIALSDDAGFSYHPVVRMHDKKGTIEIPINFLQGKPGHKYFLDINVNYMGDVQQYHAETTMLPTPAITRVGYTIRKGEIGKSDSYVPLVSFEDPQEKNYYLFQLCEGLNVDQANPYRASQCISSGRAWGYSVMEDTYLPHDVHDLSIDDGATVSKSTQFYPDVVGSRPVVLMHSIDKDTYQFYKAMLSQFDFEGGAYTQTPATPKGNVSNGALGFFRATQVSGATVLFGG